jgi:hypothetical protein
LRSFTVIVGESSFFRGITSKKYTKAAPLSTPFCDNMHKGCKEIIQRFYGRNRGEAGEGSDGFLPRRVLRGHPEHRVLAQALALRRPDHGERAGACSARPGSPAMASLGHATPRPVGIEDFKGKNGLAGLFTEVLLVNYSILVDHEGHDPG